MISILLAIYNGDRYLRESIDSVLSQTFIDFELIIGLNGTIDGSRDIVSSYDDDRIRIFDYGNDIGKSRTLNKLIGESSYDWIGVQDDDDVWLDSKLEKQVRHLDKDVIGTYISYIDAVGKITGSPNLYSEHNDITRLSMSGNNQVANTSAIFRKSNALKIGGWREGLDGIEDYDFWLRMMRSGCIFYNIPEKLVLHRLHSSSNFNTKKYDINKIL